MSEKTPEYMSLEEVAGKMGVTYQLIYRLVRSGELPAVRIGKLYRVSQADWDAYLENSRSRNAGGTCSVCGTFYRSKSSLTQTCTEEGCGKPICFECWTRKGVRTCPAHSKKTK